MKYPTNPSSFSITFKISFGSLLVVSPTFGGEPNLASYGDLLMPSWKGRFFWNWMNFNPTAHLVGSLSRIQLTIMSWLSAFDCSTLPCDCGCRGLPWTIAKSGHNTLSSLMISVVNSRPLSDCKIWGAPQLYKIWSDGLVIHNKSIIAIWHTLHIN